MYNIKDKLPLVHSLSLPRGKEFTPCYVPSRYLLLYLYKHRWEQMPPYYISLLLCSVFGGIYSPLFLIFFFWLFLGNSFYTTSCSCFMDINTFPIFLKITFRLFSPLFSLIAFLVVDLFLANVRHGGSHSFICKKRQWEG